MQQQNLRPHRNKEDNGKKSYERYQKHLIDDKESYERCQICKNGEEKITEHIEIMKLQTLSSQKKKYILRKNLMK